jgi:hypothetical protein
MRQCEVDLEDGHSGFRLIQALSWTNSPTCSICCIMLFRLVVLDGLWAATFIVRRTAL